MINLKQYGKGEVILNEDELGEVAYQIEKGLVEISRTVNAQKVVLAEMKDGDIFGEMGMIDESPRSATVTALEDTIVKELPRDEFFDSLQNNPDDVVPILAAIFERLRDANVKILQLEALTQSGNAPVATPDKEELETASIPEPEEELQVQQEPVPAPIESDPFFIGRKIRKNIAYIEGLTKEAVEALPKHPYPIMDFPVLIGRKSNDPFANNDLEIDNDPPYVISRHHLKIIFEQGKLGAIDRCSTMGSLVQGKLVGGKALPGPVYFDGKEGEFTLGKKKSPYKYKIYLKN